MDHEPSPPSILDSLLRWQDPKLRLCSELPFFALIFNSSA
jgi:hypothetical protein